MTAIRPLAIGWAGSGDVLMDASRRFPRAESSDISREMAAVELTPAQSEIMGAIADVTRPWSLRDAAEALGCDPMREPARYRQIKHGVESLYGKGVLLRRRGPGTSYRYFDPWWLQSAIDNLMEKFGEDHAAAGLAERARKKPSARRQLEQALGRRLSVASRS
jgi:hypothetical protein